MRAQDIASLGKFAQAPAVRRDMAKIVSHIEIVAARGTDVTEHIENVRAFLKSVQAGLLAVEKSQKEAAFVGPKPQE